LKGIVGRMILFLPTYKLRGELYLAAAGSQKSLIYLVIVEHGSDTCAFAAGIIELDVMMKFVQGSATVTGDPDPFH